MFTKILGLALVVGSLSGTANAAFWNPPPPPDPYHGGGYGPPARAPEIDPASAMSALTMLASGLVILRGRRFKK